MMNRISQNQEVIREPIPLLARSGRTICHVPARSWPARLRSTPTRSLLNVHLSEPRSWATTARCGTLGCSKIGRARPLYCSPPGQGFSECIPFGCFRCSNFLLFKAVRFFIMRERSVPETLESAAYHTRMGAERGYYYPGLLGILEAPGGEQ